MPGVADFLFGQVLTNEGEHADPLGEDDDFGFGFEQGGVDDFFQFVELGGDAGFFVEDELGVAEHAHAAERSHQALVLLIDPPLRVLSFIILHAVIYMVSADWFGSFGGSRLTALRVVAPTLARSALFENISGVYLYATLASAVPHYAAAFRGKDRFFGAPFRFRGRTGPVLAALALFVLVAALLTIAAKLIMRLQSG